MDSSNTTTPANMLAAILIASFAIDRIVTGIMYLLPSFLKSFPDPAKSTQDADRYKLIYFCLAAVLSVLVIAFWGPFGILEALGLPDPLKNASHPRLSIDGILTLIVLIGGADRISGSLESRLGSTADTTTVEPIKISGTITLKDKEAA